MQAQPQIPTTLLNAITASVRAVYDERLAALELRVQQLEARQLPQGPPPPN